MRHVRWSDDALDDLEQQIIRIASDNIMAAQQVAKRIRETGNDLSAFGTGHPGRVSGTYKNRSIGFLMSLPTHWTTMTLV